MPSAVLPGPNLCGAAPVGAVPAVARPLLVSLSVVRPVVRLRRGRRLGFSLARGAQVDDGLLARAAVA
eukprot:4859432-Alexandrium_andersonii.AAC.1